MGTRNRVRRTVVAFTPRAGTLRWVNEELAGEPYRIVGVTSLAELVARLRERSNIITVIDFDGLSEGDVATLLALRDAPWRGELIALGRVESEVRELLRVREMLVRPFGSERLRKALSEITVDRSTQLLPVLADAPSATT